MLLNHIEAFEVCSCKTDDDENFWVPQTQQTSVQLRCDRYLNELPVKLEWIKNKLFWPLL